MKTVLLYQQDLQGLLEKPNEQLEDTTYWLTTAMDLVSLAEQVKKGVNGIDPELLTERWRKIEKHIQLLPLDGSCLARAMFDRAEDGRVMGFWPAAIEAGVSPFRRVRRLILRPIQEHSWLDQQYNEGEALYSNDSSY